MSLTQLESYLQRLRERAEASAQATTLSPDFKLMLERKLGPISGPIKPTKEGSFSAAPKKEEKPKDDSPEKEAQRKKVLSVGTEVIPHHPKQKCPDPEERFNDDKGKCVTIPLGARAHAATGKALHAKSDSSRHHADAAEFDKDAHDAHKNAAHELRSQGFKTVADTHHSSAEAETKRRSIVRTRMLRKAEVRRVKELRKGGTSTPEPVKAEPVSHKAPVRELERRQSDSSAELMAVRKRIAAQAGGKT